MAQAIIVKADNVADRWRRLNASRSRVLYRVRPCDEGLWSFNIISFRFFVSAIQWVDEWVVS